LIYWRENYRPIPELKTLPDSAKVALAGGALTAVGSVLPWASTLGQSMSGLDGDGVITLFLGVIVAAVVLFADWNKLAKGGAAALGGISTIIAFNAYSNLANAGGLGSSLVSPGYGLYLTILGGLVVAVGALLGYTSFDEDEEPDGTPSVQ